MRKYVAAFAVFLIISVVIGLRGQAHSALRPSVSQPEYTLKTWRVEDDGSYLWSIEGEPRQGYTGALYKSLASPSLRDRIGRFPAGTKLTWNFSGKGTRDGSPHEDIEGFREFCKSKNIEFVYTVNLF
jgi:hypothetical protein